MKFSDNASDLHGFIYEGDWKAVLNHLETFPGDATIKDDNGWLPLHWAALYGAPTEVIKMLVQIRPKSINAKNKLGDLPLHLYLYRRSNPSLEIVQLLQNEAAVRTANDNGHLPLHAACGNRNMNLDVFKSLLNSDPEAVGAIGGWGKTPLHIAACNWVSNQSELFEELLKRNPSAAKVKDNNGRYPLHLACNNKDFSLSMIERIVEAYPKALNTKDKRGNLPNPGRWFMEVLELKMDFNTTMQGMTVVAAGAVLESNRLKRGAGNEEPEESVELKKARTLIETLEAKNKDLEQKAKKYQRQVESMGNSLLALGKSMENDSE